MDQLLLLSLLAQTLAFSTVPTGGLRSLAANLEVVDLTSSESYCFTQNDWTGYILPLKGFLTLQKENKDRPHRACIWLPVGGLWRITRIDSQKISVTVEPIGDSLLGLLSKTGFDNLVGASPLLRLALVRSCGLGLEQATKQYARRLHVPLPARTAHLLLELHKIGSGESKVSCTQQQLAKLLSTYRATVNRHLGEFRRKGWIETGMGWIRLLDIPALMKMAGSY